MTTADSLLQQNTQGSRTSVRWLWLLAGSILLHSIIIAWSVDVIDFPSFKPPDDSMVIATRLITPPKIMMAVAPPPKPGRKRRTQSVAPPPAESTSQMAPAIADVVPDMRETQGTDDTDDNADIDAADTHSATTPPSASMETGDGVPYKVRLPPSINLEYDVQKTSKENAPMYGHGTISWQTDGNNYTVNGDAGVLFFTVLTFKSEGTIDDTGIVPELYSEKRFRKSETNTHFHRERNAISFSASTKSYPRTGVEQDRASVIWQLAGIGRGDSEKFVPGAEIDLIVAGTRDMDMWRMQIVGKEEIKIDGDATTAWHVTRVPRSGSHDQKLDIWLAPQQNWYPVRLRYTDTNGDYLDMSLSGMNVPATH